MVFKVYIIVRFGYIDEQHNTHTIGYNRRVSVKEGWFGEGSSVDEIQLTVYNSPQILHSPNVFEGRRPLGTDLLHDLSAELLEDVGIEAQEIHRECQGRRRLQKPLRLNKPST